MSRIFILLIPIFVLCSLRSEAQQQDSTAVPKETKKTRNHSPRGATIRSAIFPGWGQFYNRKYWKMPIIWAAAGVTGYYIGVNIDRTTAYRKAYEIKTNEDLTDDDQIKDILNFDEFGILYTSAELLILRNIYRNYLDISIIAFTLVYILNLVDATVDGHFYAYDISDDLSLDIRPSLDLTRGGLTPGITLALRL